MIMKHQNLNFFYKTHWLKVKTNKQTNQPERNTQKWGKNDDEC